jgi:hypothetical protein
MRRDNLWLHESYVDLCAHHWIIETWAISGKHQTTRMSAWAWPVQQRPTVWKAWKDAIEFLAPERTVTSALGAWIKEHRQIGQNLAHSRSTVVVESSAYGGQTWWGMKKKGTAVDGLKKVDSDDLRCDRRSCRKYHIYSPRCKGVRLIGNRLNDDFQSESDGK